MMNTFEAMAQRRSIRHFLYRPVSRESVEKLLESACLAPSAKNGQPWRFVVLEGEGRRKLADLMRQGAAWCKEQGMNIGSAEGSARVIDEAPVTVVVFNVANQHEGLPFDHVKYNAPDIQSIGAAIQNMLLAGEMMGLGSLWIADVLFAYPLIREWLNRKDELVAAVSFGYAAEVPSARPRRPWQELTEWKAN
jgi:F420 biosynthesis protein FbiB-like protein